MVDNQKKEIAMGRVGTEKAKLRTRSYDTRRSRRDASTQVIGCNQKKLKEMNISPVRKTAHWSEEETQLLIKLYPRAKEIRDIMPELPGKTYRQIRSKINNLGLKKILRSLRNYKDGDMITCELCRLVYSPFGEDASLYQRKNSEEFLVSYNCSDCDKKIDMIQYYRLNHGIMLDKILMYETFDVLQWYKWTVIEKTPNNTYIRFPPILQTAENIKIVARYAIKNLINLKTREEILTLSKKQMDEYKLSFYSYEGVRGIPTNLIRLAFPELEFLDFEKEQTRNGYWSEYDNFLEAVYHHYSTNRDAVDTHGLSHIFTRLFLDESDTKIDNVRKVYYTHKTWKDIAKDAGIQEEFKDNKISEDGEKFDSVQEKTIYEFLKGYKKFTVRNNRLGKEGSLVFTDKNFNNRSYIPDFIITLNSGEQVIVEHFGMYKKSPKSKIFKEYNKKTHEKIRYYKELDDYQFIYFFEDDLKNDFEGIKRKLEYIL